MRVIVADANIQAVQEAVWTVRRSALSMMFPMDGYMHGAAFIGLGREKMSRAEIAFRLGFNTASNFFVAFRGATGETPRRFREANQR